MYIHSNLSKRLFSSKWSIRLKTISRPQFRDDSFLSIYPNEIKRFKKTNLLLLHFQFYLTQVGSATLSFALHITIPIFPFPHITSPTEVYSIFIQPTSSPTFLHPDLIAYLINHPVIFPSLSTRVQALISLPVLSPPPAFLTIRQLLPNSIF